MPEPADRTKTREYPAVHVPPGVHTSPPPIPMDYEQGIPTWAVVVLTIGVLVCLVGYPLAAWQWFGG